MPILIVVNSLSAIKPVTCGTTRGLPDFLSRVGRARLLCLYAAVATGGRRMAAGRSGTREQRQWDNDGMGVPLTTPTADPPPGGQTRVRSPWAVARAAVVAPFTGVGSRAVVLLAGLPSSWPARWRSSFSRWT